MTENEKRLRRELLARMPGTSEDVFDLLDEILAERASTTRAEALEEAAAICDVRAEAMRAEGERTGPTYIEGDARRIRALITTPAPASIPVEGVREVLIRERNVALVAHQDLPVESVIDDIARGLGVPLDAAQETRACGEPRANHDDSGRIVKFNGGNKLTLCDGFRTAQEAKGPVTHRRSGAQWAACGANGPIINLSSNPADVTCEDSRCKVPSTHEAVDPTCECGEVLSAHRRGGRRGIDEVDPPYRTFCVGFRAKVTPTLLDAPMPRQCGGCSHRIHAPGACCEAGTGRGGGCDCRWAP